MTSEANNRDNELQLFILDSLQYDEVEGVEQIHGILNSDSDFGWKDKWGKEFSLEEIRSALIVMVKKGLVIAYDEKTSDHERMERVDSNHIQSKTNWNGLWFSVSKAGQEFWRQWKSI